MGDTIFDALGTWYSTSRIPTIVSLFSLTAGAYLATSQDARSTFFCASHGTASHIIFLQWAGLIFDAAIILMLWRVLTWSRTTKIRLKTLAGVLLTSAVATGLLYSMACVFRPSRPTSYNFRGLDSLYVFDIVFDGLMLSSFLISTSLLVTEGSPLPLVVILTFISALIIAIRRTSLVGSWENVSPSATFSALLLICTGFSLFVFANNLRTVVFLHRVFVVLLLVILAISATVYTLIVGQQVLDGHPLDKLIYDARIESSRWLIQARVSDSLPVAVREYKERHHGRDPPPKFDVWYEFAKERSSVVIDDFAQIERDVFPFYGISPGKIRQDTHQLGAEPGIVVLRIHNGTLTHGLPPDSPDRGSVDELAAMISTFGKHLPDGLELALNLNDQPRVLAPEDDTRRFSATANHKGLRRLLSQRSLVEERTPTEGLPSPTMIKLGEHTAVRALRDMTAVTCPPRTKMRSGVYWDIRDFCHSCAKPQSQGQFITKWSDSLQLCHQSDLLRLHGFHMVSPELRPLQELLPVFSRSKTTSYADIVIPLRRSDEQAARSDGPFMVKRHELFWRAEPGGVRSGSHELWQGGHQERLVHLLNNVSSDDKTTLVLPIPKKQGNFAYERVPTRELNPLLPLNVNFMRADEEAEGDSQFVLITDSDNGPPRNFLNALRSNAVPFLATIFREWHTDRLLPWVHFVPVDLRLHALHSTLSYFTGLNRGGEAKLNGRTVKMAPNVDNAKWIAEEGRRFASKAVRREDMEVYLFRLLIEWTRVVDDKRDELGFVIS